MKPKRRRVPSHFTIDPLIKEAAKNYAVENGTSLSQLITRLLVEHLKAAGRWPITPSFGS